MPPNVQSADADDLQTNAELTFERPIVTSDWKRFYFYANLVKELEIEKDVVLSPAL